MGRTIRLKLSLIRLNYFSMALIAFYCRDLFYQVFQRVLENAAISEAISLGFMYGFLLIGAAKRPSKFKMDAVILIGVVAVLFLGTYVVYPDYRYALTELPTWNAFDAVFTFSKGIFAYLFFRCMDDKKLLRKTLIQCACVLLLWCIIRIGNSLARGGFTRTMESGIIDFASYDMTLGYRLLFVSIIFGIEFFERKGMLKVLYGILAVVSMICMVIFGPRTSVASFVMFWTLKVLFCSGKRHSERKIAFIVMGAIVAIILTTPELLQGIGQLFEHLGVKSRILDTLIAGEVSLDLGRQRMWTQSLSIIQENPVFGAGIFADRASFGIYCHQLFLEVFLDFGIILGSALLLGLAVLCLSSLRTKDLEWRLLFVVFFSLCFVRLMLSSSFWVDTNFWAMLAIAFNIKADERRKTITRICA